MRRISKFFFYYQCLFVGRTLTRTEYIALSWSTAGFCLAKVGGLGEARQAISIYYAILADIGVCAGAFK